jgi:hypothetical protein
MYIDSAFISASEVWLVYTSILPISNYSHDFLNELRNTITFNKRIEKYLDNKNSKTRKTGTHYCYYRREIQKTNIQ